MSGAAERLDGIPPAFSNVEDIWLYGTDISTKEEKAADPGKQRVLVFGFCFEGHCYRLSIPAEYHFNGTGGPRQAFGCGYQNEPGYQMWRVEKTTKVARLEKRSGPADEMVLEYNLPGRSPASMTYSAKVVIGSNAGKVYE